MARLTKRDVVRKLATAKAAAGQDFAVVFSVACVGAAADPRWLLQAAIVEAAGGSAVSYDMADDSGKVKVFPTIDKVIQFVSQVNESNNGDYSGLEVSTGIVFASKVPANIYTDAERKIVVLNKLAPVQDDKREALASLLSGPMLEWATGNAAQQARYAEVNAQRIALEGDVSAIEAEVVRLQAIVDSENGGGGGA